MRKLAGLAALAALGLLAGCAREDGLPDPPVQMLVPCDPAAPAGDPTACPPDQAVDVDAGAD